MVRISEGSAFKKGCRIVYLSYIATIHTQTFSGLSVGFCINEEEGYLLPTVARTFALMTTGAFSRNVGKLFLSYS